MLYRRIINLCCLALFACLFAGCEPEEPVNNQPSRLFRPGSLSRLVEGTDVTLSWIPIKNATYYLEYGRAAAGVPFDSVADLQSVTLGRVSSHKLEGLWGSTRYAIRMKAVSTLPEVKDSEYVYSNFTTGSENIFFPLEQGLDGSNFFITAKWDATKEVSHLTISNLQLGQENIQLSAAEIAAGEKKIENNAPMRLRAGQQYTINIYLGERERGKSSITLQRPTE